MVIRERAKTYKAVNVREEEHSKNNYLSFEQCKSDHRNLEEV